MIKNKFLVFLALVSIIILSIVSFVGLNGCATVLDSGSSSPITTAELAGNSYQYINAKNNNSVTIITFESTTNYSVTIWDPTARTLEPSSPYTVPDASHIHFQGTSDTGPNYDGGGLRECALLNNKQTLRVGPNPKIGGNATDYTKVSKGGGGGTGTLVELAQNEQFDFGSGTKTTGNTYDIYAPQGAKMDIGGNGTQNIYYFNSTYASLNDVPSTDSGGDWASNIEGSNGLAGRAFLVKGSGNKYYKVWIQSNDIPTLKIYWAAL